MASQIKPRSQRRMEKKQTLLLLILVLAVSLVSFSLGVMVGRNGPSTPVATQTPAAAAPTRMPIAKQAANPEAPAAAPKASAQGKEKLTFYDTLPKGNAPPMGSGINLPPGQKTPEKEKAASAAPVAAHQATAPPAPAAENKSVAATPQEQKPAAAPGTRETSKPVVKPAGSIVVQVASFRRAEDAAALRQRLIGKGYTVFIRKADLGAKGVWNRVFVGPFASSIKADRVADRLTAEERLSVLVKRR